MKNLSLSFCFLFLVIHGFSQAEIDIKGNGISIVDGDITPSTADNTDFGSQSVCSGSVMLSYSIENTGTSDLVIGAGGISIGGVHAGDFSISGISLPITINASGSASFSVVFDPSAIGLRSATISLISNDANESPYDFALEGTGIDPEINITGNGNNIPDGQTTPTGSNHTGFGPVLVCSGTNTRTYTIQNTGTGTLNISGTSITGTHASDFSVTSTPPATIAPGSSTTFQVTFDPSATGSRVATVNVFTDDCDEATYDFAIQGMGTADVTAPVANCMNISVNLDPTGNATITAASVNNGSSDNCGIDSISVSPNSFTCANIGVNTVTLTVTDLSGNISTCSATVTVNDVTPPVASCQNINAYLGPSGIVFINGSMVNNGSTDACGIASMTVNPSAFICLNLGATIPVTLTVTDNSGNTATCISMVTVVDTLPPVANCQNATLNLDATGNATLSFADIDNGSSDNCGMAAFNISPNMFNCADVGSHTVTLTLTDVSANIAYCTSTVTIVDTIAPTANCQNATLYLDASGSATLSASNINNGSSDVCGIASLTVSQTLFGCNDIGANSITLTVTDNNGNSSTCMATVTVMDTINPVVACQDINVSLDASGNATVTAAMVDNGSTDECNIASMSLSPNTFDCTNIGANPVTLTVTDNSGNSVTCSAIVTIDPPEPDTNIVALCYGESITVGVNTYSVTGMYTDSLTNMQGCDSIIVTDLNIASAIDNSTLLFGTTIVANSFATSYQWIDCNNGNLPIAGETSQNYTATANGDYAVIININGCVDTSACVNINNVGIQDMDFSYYLNVFPNPTDGDVTISVINLTSEDLSITILGIDGTVIRAYNQVSINGSYQKVIETSGISAGVYLVKITADGGSRYIRLIKK